MAEEKAELNKVPEMGESVLEVRNYGWGIRHLQIACMTLNLICMFIVRASMSVAVLAMSDLRHKNNTDGVEIFDWDKKTQSLILSSFFWGYVIMQIPGGILARRFGGKPMLLLAISANAVVCVLVPVLAAHGGWILVCAARAITGLTQSFVFPASHTLIGQWLPASERTKYSAIVYGGSKIGTITAMALCGVLAESALGWKSIFYTIAGILCVNLVVWYFLTASCPREHRWITKEERKYIEAELNLSDSRRPKTPWKFILKSKSMWAILGPHIAFAICFVLFLVDMPTYLEKGLGISIKSSALLSTLPYIGMWCGSIFASCVSEMIYNKGLLHLTVCRKLFQSISLVGVSIGLVILSFLGSEDKSLIVITLVACLTMCGFSSAGFLVNQLDLSPNFAGVMMSIHNFFATAASAVLPILTSYILRNDPTDVSRWRIVFLMVAGISVIGAMIYLIFGTSERQQWDDPKYLSSFTGDQEELRPALKERKKVETMKQMKN